jgi:T5SS/PEP-CTERM-associated repeat protein
MLPARFVVAIAFASLTANTALGRQQGVTIVAEAFGDQNIQTAETSNLTNGDFSIVGTGTLADAVDEDTYWVFDDWYDAATQAPFTDFGKIANLTGARLTLGLATRGGEVDTDWVELLEEGFDNLEEVQNLPAQTTIEFVLQLFEFDDEGYTPESILDVLVRRGGDLEFHYSDDALLFYAKLELTYDRLCESIEWNNLAGGDFTTPGNWLDLTVPGRDTTAVFAYGDSYTVVFPEDVVNNSVEVARGRVRFDLRSHRYSLDNGCTGGASVVVSGDDTELTLTGGGMVTTSRSVEIRGQNSPVLRVEDSTSLTVAPGDIGFIDVGGSTGTATLEVRDRGTVVSAVIDISPDDGVGQVIVEGADTRLTSDFIRVGLVKDGSFRIASAARASVQKLDVSVGDYRDGAVLVTGTGSQLDVSGHTRLGVKGRGEIVVSDMGSFVADTVRLGIEEFMGRGWLEITTGGVAIVGNLVVGDEGSGQLYVDGGALFAQSVRVKGVGDEDDAVHVFGSGSGIIADRMETGFYEDGPATVRISEGGHLEAQFFDVGVENESHVRVESGSVRSDILSVGMNGVGLFDLSASGSAGPSTLGGASGDAVEFLDVGSPNGSRGVLTVEDRSTVRAEEVWVGSDPASSILVHSGGLVHAGRVLLGLAGGIGYLEVDNAGMVVERLSLGPGGGGHVVVSNNGVLRVGSLRVGSGSTIDVLGGRLIVRRQTAFKHLEALDDSTAVEADTLFLSHEATVTADSVVIGPGGVVGGSYVWTTDYTNDGGVSPGDSVRSAGTFRVGADYVQTAFGTLEIEVGGPGDGEYDRLVVDGTASLSGILRFDRIDGYVPELGASYEIVQAGAVTGTFGAVVAGDFFADVVYGETTVTLVVTSSVDVEPGNELPTLVALHQNFPNPFNPVTTIAFDLPESARTSLIVFDAVGREVRRLVDGVRPAGRHQVVLDAEGLPSGVYLYRLRAAGIEQTRQLVLLR